MRPVVMASPYSVEGLEASLIRTTLNPSFLKVLETRAAFARVLWRLAVRKTNRTSRKEVLLIEKDLGI